MASSDPARLTPVAAEKARLCILAARLRTRRMKFTDIATELGLSSPQAAKQAVSVGLGLMPSENFAETRREVAEGLDEKEREAWRIVENPPPMTTVSGKLVLDPATGGPIPDAQAKIAALRLLLEISKARRQLYGVDAPKQSVSFTGNLEDLRAEVERRQRELDAFERGDGDDGAAGALAIPPRKPPSGGGSVSALPSRE
jgi:hypothetical protein